MPFLQKLLYLTFPFLPPLLPFPAPGRCFGTWALITSQFSLPSLNLSFSRSSPLSAAASYLPLSLISASTTSHPRLISLCHLISKPSIFQPFFPCHVWSDLFHLSISNSLVNLAETILSLFFPYYQATMNHARCFHSRLCYNGHRLSTNSFLFRFGNIESSSCRVFSHPTQDIHQLIYYCLAGASLYHSLFCNSFSLYNLWSRPWGIFSASGAPWSIAMALSLGRGKVTTAKLVNKSFVSVKKTD